MTAILIISLASLLAALGVLADAFGADSRPSIGDDHCH